MERTDHRANDELYLNLWDFEDCRERSKKEFAAHLCYRRDEGMALVFERLMKHWAQERPPRQTAGMPKLVFALHQSGRVLHVADVASGLACQCVCLDCKEPLVARKGPIREHHFGHNSGDEHDWAWETHLHAYAKQLIADAGGLTVPLHETVASHLGLTAEKAGAHLKAGVAIQQEVTRGRVRPDLVLHLAERDVEIALEVRVTHGCDPAKRGEFKRQRLAALEIDLRRFPPEGFDPKKLADAVLHRTENKTWLWPLPPRPVRSWVPLPEDEEAPEYPDQPFVKPQLPRKPSPPPATLLFAVSAWKATVTDSVLHSDEDHIRVQVMEMAVGRMASTNAEQAAPRIAELVGGVVNMHSLHAENPRAGTWLVPSWEATKVANGLQEAALRYRAHDSERRRAQAAALEADFQHQRNGWSRQRPEPARPEPPKDPSDNPYARRRG